MSSAEAKFNALSTEASHTIWWLLLLLEDLWIPITDPVPWYEDNKSTIKIEEDSRDNKIIYHVDTKYHFIGELIQQKRMDIQFISSSMQQAGIMTQVLPSKIFEESNGMLGLQNES